MRQPFLPLIALLALLALLPAGRSAQAGPGGPIAPTHFSPSSLSRYCNTSFQASGLPAICAEGPGSETLTPNAPYDTSLSFSIPWGHMNFSQTVASTPPDASLAPSSGVGGLPLGAIVGKLRFGTTLGLANSPCNPLGNETGTLETNYTFFNATTQTNLMLEPFLLAGASAPEGTAEIYRDDIDGNGVPDHDEPSATPDNDAVDTAGGQQEEPHGVCNDDIDQDEDTTRDANATLNGGGADASGADGGCADLAGDGDRDGLVDAGDNCDAAFNPSQRNTDGDADGDACDTNDDGDAQTDATERACGSRALNSASVCEIADNGADDDKDGAVDESAVPVTLNSFAAFEVAGPAGDRWANHDRDGDGYALFQERLLGTAPNVTTGDPVDADPCGGYLGAGTDGWPNDHTADNRLNIADLNSYLFPNRTGDNVDAHGNFNMFIHTLDDDGDTVIESNEDPGAPGGTTFNVQRWNLQLPPHLGTSAINIGDFGTEITGFTGSPARPPMFGGQGPIWTNSGLCPFAP